MKIRLGAVIATTVIAGLFAQSAHSQIRVKERTTYYTVTGKTGKALFKSIRSRGPKLGKSRHAVATTTSKIRIVNIKPGVRGSKCVIASGDVVLDLTYRYPKWNGKKSASPKLRKAWDSFNARLVAHEKQHGAIAKEQARKVHRAIRQLSGRVANGCKDFGKTAKSKFAKLIRETRREHQLFDTREAWGTSRITRLQKALFLAR